MKRGYVSTASVCAICLKFLALILLRFSVQAGIFDIDEESRASNNPTTLYAFGDLLDGGSGGLKRKELAHYDDDGSITAGDSSDYSRKRPAVQPIPQSSMGASTSGNHQQPDTAFPKQIFQPYELPSLPEFSQRHENNHMVWLKGRLAMILEKNRHDPSFASPSSGKEINDLPHPLLLSSVPRSAFRFAKRFRTSLDQSGFHVMSENIKNQIIQNYGNLPIRLWPLAGIMLSGQFTMRIVYKSGGFIPPRDLNRLLVAIVYGTYYSHWALIQKLGHMEFEEKLQNNFFDWLHQEVFCPESSLPILGRGNTKHQEDSITTFGVVQMILLEFLSTPWQNNLMVYHTSAKLIGIWYQIAHYELWKFHWKIDESKFINWLLSETARLIQTENVPEKSENLKYTKEFHHNYYKNSQVSFDQGRDVRDVYDGIFNIDQVELERIMKNSLEIFRKFFFCKSLEMYISETKQFIDNTLSSLKYKQAEITMIHDGPLAKLTPRNTSQTDSSNRAIIRVIKPGGELVVRQKIFKMFNSLVKYVHFFHAALIKKLEMSVRASSHQAELLEWLCEELFHPSSSLPVIGILENNASGSHQDEDVIGTLQLGIAQYFREESRLRSSAHAVCILGIWYKQFHPEIWSKNWDDELQFSRWVSVAIKEYSSSKNSADRLKYEYFTFSPKQM